MSENKIAIVGYGYRMPGGIANDEDFWDLLSNRKIIQTPVAERYGNGYEPFVNKNGPGRFAASKEGLIIEDQELLFDSKLFGISSHEAKHMDPQIKLLLTTTWEAFEKAGWDLHGLRNSNTGVFVGTQISPTGNWRSAVGTNEFTIPGSSLSMFANRISYHFNLMGPSTTTLTACSSGISALHAAMNAFKCNDCEQAVVASSSYLGSYFASAGFGALGVISPDGKCYSFDANANGYMRAEGIFSYILKPLAKAEEDGDHIHAVIAETMLNTAGAAEGTTELIQGRYITAPTAHAQMDLMAQTCNKAGLDPKVFDYIEGHATGTKLGDRIEGNAIGQIFGGFEREMPLRIAGVKSNVGHMEAAAFHCALMKIILMIQRRTFAPISNNYVIPNPEIDFTGHNMKVQTNCEPFPDSPVTIGINSFGFGGANGMCIIQEHNNDQKINFSKPVNNSSNYLFPLSARNKEALDQYRLNLIETLTQQKFNAYHLAGNLSCRRSHFNVRSYVIASNYTELLKELTDLITLEVNHIADHQNKNVLMVFSGQGTQWEGCGKTLYEKNSVFRRTIDKIDKYWKILAGFSIKETVFNATQEELDECELAQPAIFMVQCGLVEMYKTWGIYPDVVTGHSAGEMGAAYASGGLSLENATKLVYHRSVLQQRTAGSGRMLAIGLNYQGVIDTLQNLDINFSSNDGTSAVEIACINAPASTVICGKEDKLQPIIDHLTEHNIPKKLLNGNIAFHSSAMEEIKEDFLGNLSFLNGLKIDFAVPFISTVTGNAAHFLDNQYWWSNIRRPVRFQDAIEQIKNEYDPKIIIEIGPHAALKPLINQCYDSETNKPLVIGSLKRESDSNKDYLESIGVLYGSGYSIDFDNQFPLPKPLSHLLPGHPKEEDVVMDFDIDEVHFHKNGEYSWGPLVGKKLPQNDLSFEVRISAKDFPWMADHKVQQLSIVPAAGYIEIILQALKNKNDGSIHFNSIDFLKPCEISQSPVRLQTDLKKITGTSNSYRFTISSKSYGQDSLRQLHCTGSLEIVPITDTKIFIPQNLKDQFTATRFTSKNSFYEHMDAVIGDNFQYGPYFQVVDKILCNQETKELLLDLKMDEQLFSESVNCGYSFPPSLMDGALQSFIYFVMLGTDISGIPIRAKKLHIYNSPSSSELICHYIPHPKMAQMTEKGQLALSLGEQCIGSLHIYDKQSGELIAHLGEYYSFHSNTKIGDLKNSKHTIQWQPKYVEPLTEYFSTTTSTQFHPASEIIKELENRVLGKESQLKIIEFIDSSPLENSVLENCLDHLLSPYSQSEYWIIGEDEKTVIDYYNKYNHHDVALRFDTIIPEKINLSEGLLRKECADIIFYSYKNKDSISDDLNTLIELLVPSGLLFIQHAEGVVIEKQESFSFVNQEKAFTLMQMTMAKSRALSADEVISKHLVLGNATLLDYWNETLKNHSCDFIDTTNIPLDEITSDYLDGIAFDQVDYFYDNEAGDEFGEVALMEFLTFAKYLIAKLEQNPESKCRLNIVTSNVVFELKNTSNSAIWGAIRSLTHELPSNLLMEIRLIDIASPSDLETLLYLSENDLREREMAIRKGKIYVPRIKSILEENPFINASKEVPYRLFVESPGQLNGLRFKTYALTDLAPDAVEIEVKAAALNFRDIMVALGRLPLLSYENSSLGHEVGMEASGIITKVGSEVKDRKKGDEVVFMKGGCIGNRMTALAKATFLKPENLSMSEAAGVLSVYVTAYYSLIHLARLKKGQRVLIHSAMGGVGQAAIAIAKNIGAEIHTTAGNEEKREALKKLGAKTAYNSHDFSWYEDLLHDTGGEGVDVIINSLAGHHIQLCLQALRPGGWHCEIGKVDIYADNALPMQVFRKNLRFLAIDVDRLMNDDPELSLEISQRCMDMIEKAILPTLPITTYPVSDYLSALRCMMNGEHRGKLILEFDSTDSKIPVIDTQSFLDPKATYLLTGALGGFGLQMIAYLASVGARHLTLMDRDKQRLRTEEWVKRQSSVNQLFPEIKIEIIYGDCSIKKDVDHCFTQIKKPLKGVFHLAGNLDDKHLDKLDLDSIEKVFSAKAKGGKHLHEATLGLNLDHFVVISSIASVFGSPSQINYSAANAYLDGLMVYRKSIGLTGLSFNMGAIAETGMAARDAHVLRMAKASGLPAISTLFAIKGLDYAMRKFKHESQVIVSLFKRIPWTVDHPDYMRFGRLIKNQDAFKMGGSNQFTLEAVTTQITAKVAELCGHETIDSNELIASFGLNSISVSELGAYVNAQFNYQVSVIDLMTKATAISLASEIIESKKENKKESADKSKSKGQEEILSSPNLLKANRIPSLFDNKITDHFEEVPNLKIIKKAPAFQSKTETARKRKSPQVSIQKLNGNLPLECQSDIDSIVEFLRKKISDIGTILAPVLPSEFKNVFITGSTGFIGCIVLKELLDRKEDVIVHCLVRAKNKEHGKTRLINALKKAELWKDEFSERIIPIIGDISKPRFGLEDITFEKLSSTIDAVYHFAADLTLASPYSKIREVNTLSIKSILDLCYTYQYKHLFYASTLGIFPQYFCQFGGELHDLPLKHQAQPDLTLMKKLFPLGLIGYPWTKLVVEQSILTAQSTGLPVAIFRLPVTGIAASTGFTQSKDIKVRIAAAVLQTGSRPEGLELSWSEPVDTVAEICSSISLNDSRINTIYHFANPHPISHNLDFSDFGYEVHSISYEAWKENCKKHGVHSPLFGYWTLIDYFAPYWFNVKMNRENPPISDRSIKEDCSFNIQWPGLISMSAQSLKWIKKQGNDWPLPQTNGTLSYDLLMKKAYKFSKVNNFPLESFMPEVRKHALEVLVTNINKAEPQILPERKSVIALNLSNKLSNLSLLKKHQDFNSEIPLEEIKRPIFIVGINRTGTTYLHNLLSQDPDFWTLKMFETLQPFSQRSSLSNHPEDVRKVYAKDLLNAFEAKERLEGIHSVSIDAPEEEFSLLEHSFSAWTSTILYDIPEFAEWLQQNGSKDAYQVHFEFMQYFNWTRKKEKEGKTGQWVLKMPFHLMELEALLLNYPDAIFIQTHRDPLEFISSWNHLVHSARSSMTDNVSKIAIGKEQVAFMSKMLNKSIAFRQNHPEIKDRWIDIEYSELVQSPLKTIKTIYELLGKRLNKNSIKTIDTWVESNSKLRKKQKRLEHKLKDFGISEAEVKIAFKTYYNYMKSNLNSRLIK